MSRECELCGSRDPAGVQLQLVRWADEDRARRGRIFEAVERCKDRRVCRDRVEGTGELWPVIDDHRDRRRG